MNELVNNPTWQQIFVLPSAQIEWWAMVIRSVLRVLIAFGFTLTIVPGLIWLERRLLSWLQGRLGPNRVGWEGLAQPIADGIKLFFKEDIIPTNVDRTLYIIAPAVALAPVLMSLAVLPWNGSPEWGAVAPGLNIGILFLLAVASIEVYGVIMAGWASNNKYSLLGGLRASSQVISYELGMGLAVIAVLLMSGTVDTQAIVMGGTPTAAGQVFSEGQGLITVQQITGTNYTVYDHSWKSGFWDWNFLRLLPFGLVAFFVYMISMVAETNRAPFDLPEAETELVAGFHTEYSSMKFAMFFMGEYANILIVSAIFITLFLGGWLSPWGGLLSNIAANGPLAAYLSPWAINFINMAILAPMWFGIKLFLLVCFFIWVRATFPRLRYDMLMNFGWKGMLPVALLNVLMIAATMALQERYGRLEGHLMGIVIAAILALILLMFKYFQYQGEKRAAAAAQTTDIAPIRRTPVATNIPPAASPTEV